MSILIYPVCTSFCIPSVVERWSQYTILYTIHSRTMVGDHVTDQLMKRGLSDRSSKGKSGVDYSGLNEVYM